jgi:cobalamin-dependent methionine synthase I
VSAPRTAPKPKSAPFGEQHGLGLLAFGLALRGRGWRIVYLGPDTPFESIAVAARTSEPQRVVVSAVDRRLLVTGRAELLDLAQEHALAVGGAASQGLDLGRECSCWRKARSKRLTSSRASSAVAVRPLLPAEASARAALGRERGEDQTSGVTGA